jgi:hypothetical protein
MHNRIGAFFNGQHPPRSERAAFRVGQLARKHGDGLVQLILNGLHWPGSDEQRALYIAVAAVGYIGSSPRTETEDEPC